MSEPSQEPEREPEVDVSDLKTYDVPDPPELASTWTRMFIGAPVGLVLALGFLSVTQASHYFAVASNRAEFGINRATARKFINELPPEEIKERVLAIEDPAARGGFHRVLAATKDPAQIEAILAYMKAYDGYATREIEEALESLRLFDAKDVGPGLVAYCQDASGSREQRFTDKARAELQEHYPPETCLESVLAIEDEVKRGSYFWVLPASKDPAQIDAIMAYVKSQGSRSSSGQTRFQAEAAALIAFGKPATPKLKEALHSQENAIVNLAAEALAKVNLEFLHGYCREELGEYAKKVPGQEGIRWAAYVQSASERKDGLAGSGLKASDLVKAKQILRAAAQHSTRIMEMLKAMETIPGEKIDYCFIHGLSCFNQVVGKYCAQLLKRRLKTSELIDVLFSFIAQKDSFTTAEVDVYESLLLETGPSGAVRVAYNLERLLKEAQGKPEQVFFLYKKMGFRALAQNGTKAQLETLELFAKDTDSYVRTGTNRMGQRTETEIKFMIEVQNAIRTIKKRGR